jgi:hypothetical protein
VVAWHRLQRGARAIGHSIGHFVAQLPATLHALGMSAEALDRLLAQLSAYGPDLTNGFTSHAPMVAEALCVMGQPAAADQWVQRHLHEGTARPPTIAPIDIHDWSSALGREHRFSDWAELFRAELRRHDWRELLDRWCARLAPGFAAAATHGIIRTAHAARAMAARASEARLDELADGLALWACAYQPLPSHRDATATVFDPSEALASVPRVPLARRRNGGAITTALGVLAELPAFAPVIAWFDPGDDVLAAGQQLARAFAEVFATQVRDPLTAIVFTHAITSTAAVLWMIPLIRSTTARELLIHAWQTGAALLAVYGEDPVPTIDRTPEPDDELVKGAIAHGDDHVIKLSGVCMWLRGQTGDSLFAALPRRSRALID